MQLMWNFEQSGAEIYDFSVTLVHDDGEAGYTNWWNIEMLNGTELGRRVLAHAHGNDPFTRSASIEIPSTILIVVIRGYDQTHGYGGQVILADITTAELEIVDQGSDRMDFTNTTSVSPNFTPPADSDDAALDFTSLILSLIILPILPIFRFQHHKSSRLQS